MGELIGGALVLLVVALFGAGIAFILSNLRRQRELAGTPPPALVSGAEAGPRVAQYYRLAQRSVRALEAVLRRDEVVPFLNEEDRNQIQEIVNEFYGL